MGTFFEVILNFVTKQLTEILNSSLLTIKDKIEHSLNYFLKLFIINTIVGNLFCFSTLFLFYELANQYDKNESIRFSAVLTTSLCISIFSLSIFILIMNYNTENNKLKTEEENKSKKVESLETAISILIMEFAKDKEFARNQQLKKEANFKHENNDFQANSEYPN